LCCTERGHVNVAAAIVGAPVKVSTELQEVLDRERARLRESPPAQRRSFNYHLARPLALPMISPRDSTRQAQALPSWVMIFAAAGAADTHRIRRGDGGTIIFPQRAAKP